MKLPILVYALAFAYPAFAAQSVLDQTVETITETPELGFAPTGFDDNDNVQVVLSGAFVNTCFKVGPVNTRFDFSNKDQKKIILENRAYFYPSSWCLAVIVPYTQVVSLGPIPAGQYEILVADREGKLHSKSKLNVAVATKSTADDFLYAAVRDLAVDTTSKPATVTLRGTLDYDCFELKEIKVIHQSPNVLEILPTLKDLDSTANCKPQVRPLDEKVALPMGLKGKTLIHVRSLNGQSVNQVVEF